MRAISGGPIYVSDRIGRTRPEILAPLTLSDGRILRPDLSAMPSADCITSDPRISGRPLKIFNRVGNAGVIAVFNVNENDEAVSGSLSAKDAHLPMGDYVYYEYFTGACGVLHAEETIALSLANRDTFRLYTLVPLKDKGVTVIGRCDKFIGVKAIDAISEGSVTLREGGKVAFYSPLPVKVRSDRRALDVTTQGICSFVTADADETTLYFQYE